MGKYTYQGKKLGGTRSEEFEQAMRDAPPVECIVCEVRFGQGNKGQALNVCIECQEYVCNEHMWRHPNCTEGR